MTTRAGSDAGDRSALARAKRVAVKVGSGVVAPGGVVDDDAIGRLVEDIALVRAGGVGVVLVSSGAVAAGFRALGLDAMPRSIRDKQAAAAVGQPALVHRYAERFGAGGMTVAQVLLTGDVLDRRERYVNARHTLTALLERAVVPIVNENDSVSHDEIKLGDNDRLSALVAGLIGADALVILSGVDGLLEEGDPARVIATVTDLDAARAHVTGEASATGTGGFATKLDAVGVAHAHGCAAVVTRGPTAERPTPIGQTLAGASGGTWFPCSDSARAARKNWLAHSTTSRGTVRVDAGAARALTERGASLLPKGITGVDGSFDAGAVIEIVGPDGAPIARGVSNYASSDLSRIAGVGSADIESVLGYTYADEAVHRDDMVVDRAR